MGEKIDSHDYVIRLKASSKVIGSKDYGSKCDVLCASTEVMGLFFKQSAKEYWAYPKKGDYDRRQAIHVIEKLEKPVMIPLVFSNYWNSRFRQMGGQHPNVSTGMAAILFSINRYKPRLIRLAGFDTLLNPDLPFSRNDQIPITGLGAKAGHDWKKENELLNILTNVYKLDIEEV